MKKLVASLLLTLSVAANAQSSEWALAEVKASKETVGFIYHVYARGRSLVANTNSSVAAGLRFVCSSKDNSGLDPIIAVFWNEPSLETAQDISIEVGNQIYRKKWLRDEKLIYAVAGTETEIISGMKKNRNIKFTWEGNGSQQSVIFDLKNFNLTDFNNSCKTKL